MSHLLGAGDDLQDLRAEGGPILIRIGGVRVVGGVEEAEEGVELHLCGNVVVAVV